MVNTPAQEIVNERQLKNLMGELYELKPWFDDEKVLNIFILRTGRVKIDHFEKGKFILENVNFPPDKIMRIINFLAAMNDHTINTNEYPALETYIPEYGFRVTAAIKPWLIVPQIAIRRPNPRIITLEEYKENGRISESHYNQVCKAISEEKNIIIIGATGSGKTTFTISCLAKQVELFPSDRFLLIEDNPELRCEAEDTTPLLIRRDQVPYAINFALRWCPQHITFGEIRNSIMAEGFLELMNSGHPGNFTTLHANSARAGYDRFCGLIKDEYDKNNISKYIDMWIFLARQRVEEVLWTESIMNQTMTLKQAAAQMSLYEGLYNVEK